MYEAAQDSFVSPSGWDFEHEFFAPEPFEEETYDPRTGEYVDLLEYIVPSYKIVATNIDSASGDCSLIFQNTGNHSGSFKDSSISINAHPVKGCYVDKWYFEPMYESTLDADKFTGELHPGEEVSFNEETIFKVTAVFAGNPTYNVTYNQNGGESGGFPQTIPTQNGSKYILPTTNPTRKGYDFDGW